MRFVLAFLISALVSQGTSHALEIDDLHGVYLGYAIVSDNAGGKFKEREMTVEIGPYKRNGLRLRWVSVELVDGRRDKTGVTYRADELLLQPSGNDNYFVATAPNNPFQQKERERPIGGDPVRWAVLDDAGLSVFSFVILDDGRFELQRYSRLLDGEGMTLRFDRIVDGKIVREITGSARRVNQP